MCWLGEKPEAGRRSRKKGLVRSSRQAQCCSSRTPSNCSVARARGARWSVTQSRHALGLAGLVHTTLRHRPDQQPLQFLTARNTALSLPDGRPGFRAHPELVLQEAVMPLGEHPPPGEDAFRVIEVEQRVGLRGLVRSVFAAPFGRCNFIQLRRQALSCA